MFTFFWSSRGTDVGGPCQRGMKTSTTTFLSSLFALSAACAAQSGPSEEKQQTLASPIDGKSAGTCTPLASTPGTANPATLYCAALGNEAGGEQCRFSDGTSCEQWAFYRGECGQAHSFCNLHGGTVSNTTEDMGSWTASYARCRFPGGASCQESSFARSCVCE